MIVRWSGADIGPIAAVLLEIAEFYPGNKAVLYVTSGRDSLDQHGFNSHHNEGHLSWNGSPTAAIDLGFGGTGNPTPGRDFAKWLYVNFATDTVELIHSTPFSDDDGFYIKYGTQYPGGGPYAGSTAAQHADHIHWAMSLASAQRVLTRLRGSPTPAAPSVPVVSDDIVFTVSQAEAIGYLPACAWRNEAMISARETVVGGPTKGEVNRFKLVG